MKKLFIALLMLTLMAVCPAVMAETFGGSCGPDGSDSVKWELNTETGVLRIYGSGPMADYMWIGMNKNAYNEYITSAVVEEGVTTVGAGTFSWFRKLSSVSLPDSLTAIGSSAFAECSGLEEIELPRSLKSIGDNAFYYSGLTKIVVPDSVTEMGEEVFHFCQSLVSAVLPKGMTRLPKGTFSYCESLEEFELPEGLVSIEKYAISNTAIKELHIPKTLTYIDPEAVNYRNKFSAIKVDPENPCYYDVGGVLYSYDGPTLMHYPIFKPEAEYAIPEGVTGVFDSSFEYAENLKKIFIPASLDIPFEETESFDCLGPAEYMVAADHPRFTVVDGVIFSKDLSVLIRFPSGYEGESYTVPDGTRELAPHSLRYSRNLKEIILPDSVTMLGSNAFMGSGIERLDIPSGVQDITRDLFTFCEDLKVIKFPEGLKVFNGFNSSIGPVILDLPDSLTSINVTGYISPSVRTVMLPDNVVDIKARDIGTYNVLLCRPGSLTEHRLRNEGIPSYSTLLSIGETPEVVGKISTDCRVLVNGCYLPAWKLRYTYFVSELDLAKAGYSFVWDPEARTTTITPPETAEWKLEWNEESPVERTADIWSTDVRFIMDGVIIPAIAIGNGESVIDINALTGSVIYY